MDHGKSTLADRLLEITKTLPPTKIVEQTLDTLALERERGITIKAHAIRMEYKGYILNLIDTPGHVDFSYEVSRSLAACEGALLLVDGSQGIEAQTVSHLYSALELGLEIVPVINKIDLAMADIEGTKREIVDFMGVKEEEILLTSAKTGEGVEEVLKAVIEKIPPPEGKPHPLRALIFDSTYDPYHGVIVTVRIFDGSVKKGDRIYLLSSGKEFEVEEVGYLKLNREPVDVLKPGEVGYIIAGIKTLKDARVGDTISDSPDTPPLKGYREVKPYIFCGFYPTSEEGIVSLGKSLEKLKLNDPAIHYEQESSSALGPGYRCGFLGLLHMEVIQERLEREFGENLIATVPSVRYRVVMKDGKELYIDNPSKLPDINKIERIEEPYARVEILTPPEYLGNVMKICNDRKGIHKKMEFIGERKVLIEYEMPFSKIIFDFYNKLKSVSKGMAAMDYEIIGYRTSPLVKLNILINGRPVDALSFLVHKDEVYRTGRRIVEKLRVKIPRQQFEVSIQAAAGKRVIAKSVIKPVRKDVTAKCYGGDITRKRKLLEKQKKGKKRLKKVGNVDIPQEAFFSVLKLEEK